jgi:hypothetical protein
VRSRWSTDHSILALCLNDVRDPERVSEPLVFYDSTLIDCTQLIVCGVGDRDAGGSDLDPSVGILVEVQVFAGIAPVLRRVGQQVELRS